MQRVTPDRLRVYEQFIHQYLDGKPIPPAGQKSSGAERNHAFFCHPLWEDVPREAIEHELFAVAYARYFQQDAVSNTTLLQRVANLAPDALTRAIRYAQLFLNLESPRWREVLQLEAEGIAGLSDFIKVQEIIQKEYRGLKRGVQQAEKGVKDLSACEFLLYASLYGFQFLLPERVRLDQHLRATVGTPTSLSLEIEPQLSSDLEDHNQRYDLATRAMRAILEWKLRTRPEDELQLNERKLLSILEQRLKPLLVLVPAITQPQATQLQAIARLIQAHMDLEDFLARSADSYSFNPDFNLSLSPCRQYTVREPTPTQPGSWEADGQKLKHLENYWFLRAIREFVDLGLADVAFGRPENHEQNQHAMLKALQSHMYLAEVYGVPNEVTLESGTRVDTLKALRSGHLTSAFFQSEFVRHFEGYYAETAHWRISMALLAVEGLRSGENRMPLTWVTRSVKARSLMSWTVCKRYPQGDLATSQAILEFWSLDLGTWAARLRADSRADLPELYERPYLQFGEFILQIPWLWAFRHNTHAAINQLRLRHPNRPGLRGETQSIEETLGKLLRERGFHVVMNYHPPRRDDEEDAGEVDVICQRDGRLFVMEVKSTYIRRNFREAWQHKYQTLRRAGVQVRRKCAAVARALDEDEELARRLGRAPREELEAIHGWIVDTCIEHDHEHFSGHLKVSLEELLIVLRDERHFLLGQPEPTDMGLFPDGFSAGRFAAIVEGNEFWPMLVSAPGPAERR